nr:IclR family transcriptional regulator C-terminal domain-containing protein [Brucella intermedia]
MIGGSVPLGVGPSSIAMLSYLDEDEQDFFIRANLERYSGYKGLTADRICELIKQTRECRYAVDNEELINGIVGNAILGQ